MRERYLAHKAPDQREQTVSDHLLGVAALAEAFAGEFGCGQQGRLVGMAHDLGKYSREFQKRLDGDTAHVDHSTWGAWECCQRGQLPAAFAVAGHHGGLPDGGSMTDSESTFAGRINRARAGKLPDCQAWKQEITLPEVSGTMPQDPCEGMFLARMLYSCLVDADYLDTEAFMDGKPRQKCNPGMEQLWQRLQEYIAPWFPPKTELNRQRCSILNRCMQEGNVREPGLYTLTVPTGGGKTVASLAFALAQARAKGLNRIIYVIPYTSIIEQTARVFREILGEENVLEHHSGIVLEGENTRLQAKATENWDMPVVVTTAVQFFESLYGAKSSKCRKLHNIAKSVVIFDEAQMLPLNYLRPCVFAIAQLVKYYGASAVLCTATQPALEPLLMEFLQQKPVELCPMEDGTWEQFRRVTLRQAGSLSWEQLAEKMNEMDQVLTIVNSRKSAQQLYRMLIPEGGFHLSTLMCPHHRSRILEQIRSRLKDGLPCRVVSTSLIEAGVDVDFPAVFREEAGLDSVLQAAGRCNREGKLPASESMVTVFRSTSAPPPVFRAAIAAGRLTMCSFENLNSREAVSAYFRELLSFKGTDAQDCRQILQLPRRQVFPFRTIAERFRLIDTNTFRVYIPLGKEARELIDAFTRGEITRSLMRKLNAYGVDVYPQHFQRLPLQQMPDGSGILWDLDLYSEAMGLSLEVDAGEALFI